MSEHTNTLLGEFSALRTEIRDKFQLIKINLNHREQELNKRVNELEDNYKNQSEGILSDLKKLQSTYKVLEGNLNTKELAGTQEATLSLITDKIEVLQTSYAQLQCHVSIKIDTEHIVSIVDKLGDITYGEGKDTVSPDLATRPILRSHTPDPYTSEDTFSYPKRSGRHSTVEPFTKSDNFSTQSLYSRYERSTPDSTHRMERRVPRTISETGHGYSTPQPVKKSANIIGKRKWK
ncbi:hypothetical protein LOD99_15828 [Oopsacas minuta]|uniref:Uncharacterized protein n=1 Tax=Oopsacas minuta TaxID=111878 RepID=A0AAV7KB16_9METZ|nr:hypothetical protein LOD99_15828 [Oopsacas minuta]